MLTMGKEKNFGEPILHDPKFNGPIHNRSCTDIVWLILFILFLIVWGYVGYYSVKHGDVEKLLAPIDSYGRRCGVNATVASKPYLVYFDITKCLSPGASITGCPTPQICVEKCPNETIVFEVTLRFNSIPFDQLRQKMVCHDEVDIQNLTQDNATDLIREGKCAKYVIKSQPVLGRCFVNVTEAVEKIESITEDLHLNATQLLKRVKNLVKFDQLSSQIVADLVQSRWYMAGALVGVVLICFIYILLLRWVVAPVVWTSIAGLFGVLGFSLYLCYTQYQYYREHTRTEFQTNNAKGLVQSWLANPTTWLLILLTVAVIIIVLLVIVIFLRSRIILAIALIKEGSKAVTAIKSTVFFPIFPWLVQCAVITYGISVFLLLMSTGESVFKLENFSTVSDPNCTCLAGVKFQENASCNPLHFFQNCYDKSYGVGRPCQIATCHFQGDDAGNIIYLHLVNLLGFFWAMYFVSGVGDIMLASTFATWYWTFHKKNLPFFTLTGSISRVLRYHLGTVAFGSLIIAIVRIIRITLEYIDHKLKKFDNPLTRCIMCCLKCFFWCLENFIKFVTKNAYIMCAVHGKNFCCSARDAYSLVMRNISRVTVLDKVMDFIFFLSKLLISIGVGFAVHYLLQWNYVSEITNGERLNYSYVPAIILAGATYLISTIFFNVYAMAVDTLFFCFLEDCERNDGSTEKPYFMSTSLMRILGKKNKKE